MPMIANVNKNNDARGCYSGIKKGINLAVYSFFSVTACKKSCNYADRASWITGINCFFLEIKPGNTIQLFSVDSP